MHSDPRGSDPSATQALLAFRIIGVSLGLGVTLFTGVSWFLHQQGGPSRAVGDPALMANLLIPLAAVAIVTAIIFWRARVAPLIESAAAGREPSQSGELQTNVVLVWALLEAPALFAVVLYFLHENVLAAVFGVALIWAGLAATWPRREWFGA